MLPNENTNAATEQPTAEQLELARLQAEAAKYSSEAATSSERILQAEKEHAAILKGQAVRDALAESKVTFYEDALAVKLSEDYELRFAEDGTATGLVDGKRVPLKQVFQAIAVKHPTLTDGRTTRHLREDEAKPQVKARSEMTQAEKIAFLDKHGIEAWEKLPARAMRTVEVRTFRDYVSLPQSAKMQLIEKHGADWASTLPRN